MGNLIVKDNALIEASHRLGEVEQRLILLAILQARSHCNTVEQLKGQTLVIHADDYIQTFGVDRTTAYRVLKKAVVSLFRAEWGYKFINEKGLIQIAYRRFIQSADYIDDGATVYFKFADDTVPMLVELERQFTTYEIEQVAQLSSQYGMRLYEFFMQQLNKETGKGWFDISLDELRFRFGLLPNEYTSMSDFKKRVLDFALKQINEKTDLSATYAQKKKGRVIVGFHFGFKKKIKKLKPKNKELERDPKTIDMFSGFTDIERQTIEQRIDKHINQLEAKGEIVGDFHRKNITQKAIAEKWGLNILAEKERKKAEKKAQRERELAQKQAEEEQDRLEKELRKQKEQKLIEIFENLPIAEQERVLDEVGKNPFVQYWNYDKKRKSGLKLYLDPILMCVFFDYFGI